MVICIYVAMKIAMPVLSEFPVTQSIRLIPLLLYLFTRLSAILTTPTVQCKHNDIATIRQYASIKSLGAETVAQT